MKECTNQMGVWVKMHINIVFGNSYIPFIKASLFQGVLLFFCSCDVPSILTTKLADCNLIQ